MSTVRGIQTVCKGTQIPHTKGGKRVVTRVDWGLGRVYMKTGQRRDKYTTVQMVEWMYNLIQSGQWIDRGSLEKKFPNETRQGPCIFSMTGGILVYLHLAQCIKCGKRYYYKK